MKLKQYNRLRRRVEKTTGRKLPRVSFPRGMNANETRFRRMVLNGTGKYEPIKIKLTRVNERVYTPDFVWATSDLKIAVIEVKGSYRLQSEDRARLAWEIAAENDQNGSVFVWARWNRGGYDCEAWSAQGSRRTKGRVRDNAQFERLLKEVV